MTEEEWLACRDYPPAERLVAPRLTDRRARLLACAWLARAVEACGYGDYFDPVWASASEAAERFADGLITSEELARAGAAARLECDAEFADYGGAGPSCVAHALTYPDAPTALSAAARCAEQNAREYRGGESDVLRLHAAMGVLLRDIVGNPFRPVALAPACRTPAVLALAQAAYDERAMPSGELDPERLAVLADALEDAGAAGDILAHLRGPGPHVRGCWALDLALGKA